MTKFADRILYEDNHLLAVVKPAGLPTMGAAEGEPSLVVLARQYLKDKYHKPGNVYLGVVSRLDALVTGVVVFARTSKAAARLSQQFASGEAVKEYWCLVERPPVPPAGHCVDWLVHQDALRRVLVVSAGTPQAKDARLSYRTLRAARRCTLLEIQLETGRKHQIRVQLAHRGWAVLGDVRYGAHTSFPEGIALHARRLEFQHPVRPTRITFEAPLPASWKSELGDG
ncbi:MAG: RluA family pseudouridine synthase [Pirellulaceae bacterium]